MSDDRSPIGIVNKEAADRRKQRRKGHIQIIEEDRKRLKMENDRLNVELAEARELLTIIADEDGWVIGAEMAGKIRAAIDAARKDGGE